MNSFKKISSKKYTLRCTFPDCNEPFEAKDLCRKHYKRLLGRMGAYKRQYDKRKSDPKFIDLKRRLDQERRARVKLDPQLLNKVREYHREWSKKPENVLKKKIYQEQYVAGMRRDVISHYSQGSMVCVRCGYNNINALDIDHIDNGGNRHRSEITVTLTQWLIKNNFPEGYQVLCKNCNWLKQVEIYKSSLT